VKVELEAGWTEVIRPNVTGMDEKELIRLCDEYMGSKPDRVESLRADGSARRLYRLWAGKRSIIGVANDDAPENTAFLSFSRHFKEEGLAVPEIFAQNPETTAYLEEDLGDETLFDALSAQRPNGGEVPESIQKVYEAVVRELPRFQVTAGEGIDDSVCYPRSSFDRQSMLWDLNYFKYYFLKLAQVPFHEQHLENDFERLTGWLLDSPSKFFLYRDFQSRNIMLRDGIPWFIDYQGGRRGALQYDLASLLYDAKADLPPDFRMHLRGVYREALSDVLPGLEDSFDGAFPGFVLMRILQAMGAYGFRGFYERKAHFLQSVPYAIRNLESLLSESVFPVELPELIGALQRVVRSTRLREIATVTLLLTVHIQSFSYKKGLPADESGHGGGFVFDCRALPNPGREERFAHLTGDDAATIGWLEQSDEVHAFMNRVRDLINQVVQAYQRRNYTYLSIGFGCTGGQHRSVYCASSLAQSLEQMAGVKVSLDHRDKPDIDRS
jgi:aminoglycoside/choline kinase family phosphotransferase